MEFLFIKKCSALYHTRLVGSFVRYKVEHTVSREIPYLHHFLYDINKVIRKQTNKNVLDNFSKISNNFSKISEESPKVV